jgi:hypothetical protein
VGGLTGGSEEGEAALKEAMGPHTWAALAKLGVGLHRYSPEQLAVKAAEWYSQVVSTTDTFHESSKYVYAQRP